MTEIRYVASQTTNPQKIQKKKNLSSTKNEIPEVRIHTSIWVRIIIFLFLALFVYLFVQIFIPLLQFKVYLDWWNKNGGKQYNKIFSIRQFAYYGNFRLYAIIGSLTSSGLTTIQNKSQYLFILSCISVWGKYDDSDTDHFLLPDHICKSIVVGDNYPTTSTDWHDKLKNDWGIPQDVNVSKIIAGIDLNKWKSKDNFLYHNYGIPAESPLILSFQSGAAEGASHEKWYPNAFEIAVGINPASGSQDAIYGGWWGFINTGFETEKATLADIYRYLYATENPQLPYDPTPTCSVWGDTSSVLGQMATWGMAGAAIGPIGGGGGALLGAIIGGITVGIKRGTKQCTGNKL